MGNNISTYDEAVYRLVTERLAAGDGVKDALSEFDIDAIAGESLVWDEAYDEVDNAYRLDDQGWRYAPAYDHESADYLGDDAFWDLASDHTRGEH